MLLLTDNLATLGRNADARRALDKTLAQLPLATLQDVQLMHRIAQAYLLAGDTATHQRLTTQLRSILAEQLDYFHTISPSQQAVMPYTLRPREELMQLLQQPPVHQH